MTSGEKRRGRVDVLGCPFDSISFAEAVDRIRQAVEQDRQLYCAVGNVDMVMKARKDPKFAQDIRNAGLVIADGVPIVWAAALLGTPLQGRISGTEIVWKCGEISAGTGCAVALIGSVPGVSDRAAEKMRERYPGARIFPVPTPFPLGPEENASLVREIKRKEAKIVLAALGAPRQERWVQANLAECGANVGIGVGSAFDIISGDKRWAPRWMRDNGLEWLFRMIQEPKRLSRRYLVEDMPFVWHLMAAVWRRRVLGRRDEAGQTS